MSDLSHSMGRLEGDLRGLARELDRLVKTIDASERANLAAATERAKEEGALSTRITHIETSLVSGADLPVRLDALAVRIEAVEKAQGTESGARTKFWLAAASALTAAAAAIGAAVAKFLT